MMGVILSTLFSHLTSYLSKKEVINDGKREAEYKLKISKIDLKIAVNAAKTSLLVNCNDNSTKLDLLTTENLKTSYKDEALIAVFFLPLILCFTPLSNYIFEGLTIIDTFPDWYIYCICGMVITIMGMRSLATNMFKPRVL